MMFQLGLLCCLNVLLGTSLKIIAQIYLLKGGLSLTSFVLAPFKGRQNSVFELLKISFLTTFAC